MSTHSLLIITIYCPCPCHCYCHSSITQSSEKGEKEQATPLHWKQMREEQVERANHDCNFKQTKRRVCNVIESRESIDSLRVIIIVRKFETWLQRGRCRRCTLHQKQKA